MSHPFSPELAPSFPEEVEFEHGQETLEQKAQVISDFIQQQVDTLDGVRTEDPAIDDVPTTNQVSPDITLANYDKVRYKVGVPYEAGSVGFRALTIMSDKAPGEYTFTMDIDDEGMVYISEDSEDGERAFFGGNTSGQLGEPEQDPNLVNAIDWAYQMVTHEIPAEKRAYEPRPLDQPVLHIAAAEVQAQAPYQVQFAEKQLHGKDAMLVDEAHGTFAVLDGVGTRRPSEVAARLGAAKIQEVMAAADGQSLEAQGAQLHVAVHEANIEVRTWEDAGHETGLATVAAIKLIPQDGKLYLAWVHVGDGTLMLRHGDTLTKITSDEGDGNKQVDNVIGQDRTHDSGDFAGIRQSGLLELEPGTDILLYTDGVGGDADPRHPGQRLTDQELIDACENTGPSDNLAQKLIDISRKDDDKVAAVIRYR